MLNNFDICINTRFIFGKGAEKQIGEILKKDGVKKVLIHHDNGQYLYDTGLLQAVCDQLTANGIAHAELGGVLPNPRLSLVREGIELAKREGIDLVLAIGGGSVIDSAKAIGLGTVSEGDVWDYFIGEREPEHTLPVAVLLTCPATGSESSQVAVVNNTDEGKKLLVSHPVLRPKYAFMDPELTYSLPKFLTACGVTDMFSHVCERYFAPDDEIGVIDRMSEGILRTLVDIGPKLLEDRRNYTYRAEIMWIGTFAHNNTVGIGRVQDWGTHEIGNELSALYDTPHGATLSIIMGSWMRYVYRQKPERFARYAREVFGVNWDGTNTLQAAEEGIVKTEEYFKSMGMPISFHDMNIPTDRIEDMLDRIAFRGDDHSIGGIVHLNRDDCRKIYEMAF